MTQWERSESCREVAEKMSQILQLSEIKIEENSEFYLGKELSWRLVKELEARNAEKTKHIFAKDSELYPLKAAMETGCFDGGSDFGHFAPDFEAILTLGAVGLRKRAAKYAEKHKDNVELAAYYEGVDMIYSALSAFMMHVSEEAAKCGKTKISDAFSALAVREPQTLFEALQLIFIFYFVILRFEATVVRTLGRLDRLLMPFYEHDIKNGIITEEEARELITKFIMAVDSYEVAANIPFAICGEKDGESSANPMSYLLIDCYAALKSPYVKIHFLYSEKTPRDLVEKAFDAIRHGANSIVFLCNETVKKSLIHVGADENDVENYSVVGCYECGAVDEVTCSCGGKLSIPKALEVTLFDGYELERGALIGIADNSEPEIFDDFMKKFNANLTYFADCTRKIIDANEKHYPVIHSSPLCSSTYLSCLENGGDIYCHGSAKYCNTSINAIGLATAVDSLVAIKKLVYEDKILTLSALKEVLRNDWEGHEELRLMVKNKYPKYGMGDMEADSVARGIFETLDKAITGKPNEKGGIYRFGTFSIDWRIRHGKMTAASADGRHKGEMLSLNSGASVGCDRNGATGNIASICSCNCVLTPNGSILDLDFHSSAVKGDEGLSAMVATLETYSKLGGFAVHYNVLDGDILRDAQKNPENYENLQVRLCGWNAKFVKLDKKSQDDFIIRADGKM